jgi:tetratricopeptide (TPR) repeat protein
MKYLAALTLIFSFLGGSEGQTKKPPAPRPGSSPIKTAAPTEAEVFRSAADITETDARIAALRSFLKDFPDSQKADAAKELLASSLCESASVRIQVGDTEGGVSDFREAAAVAPSPIPEKLYNETISKIVPSLYFHGEKAEALEIGETLEPKIQGNLAQLLSLGGFYVSTENGAAAKRLALKAVEVAPTSSDAFLMLALAHRMQFELEQSAVAYSKAMDLDPASVTARRGLADMYRALGRFADAIPLYKEILSKDESNTAAQTGLILAMFGSGEKTAAESELGRSLESNPNNVILLAGAAYWYANHSQPDRAIELAQKAIANDPRYVWSHLALARGYLAKQQPLQAEEALLRGRQYGRFPTLEYELAFSRAAAGLYREAVEGLRGSFTVENNKIKVLLGGRVERADTNFTDLLAPERQASIFEPEASEDPQTVAVLKSLLAFDQELQASTVNEEALTATGDRFIDGDDPMKVHRQVYVASALLEKKIALPKVVELTRSAVSGTDAGLMTPSAAAAVMASELYESRMTALARDQYVHVPDVPRQTLSAILRGRIEELAGWALYQQGKSADSVIRLRRAVSVLPEKSAWWRSSMWKLGAALQADGKDAEALDSYIKSYKTDRPDAARYIIVAALYKKVRGTDDGLEAEIGPNPIALVASSPSISGTEEKPAKPNLTPSPSPAPAPTVSAAAAIKEAIPREVPVAAVPNETKEPETQIKTNEGEQTAVPASQSPKIDVTPAEKALPESPSPVSEPKATPEQSPVPEPVLTPEVTASPAPTMTPQFTATPVPTLTPEVMPAPEPTTEPTSLPKVEATPERSTELPSLPKVEPTPAITPAPEVVPAAEPSPSKAEPAAPEASPTPETTKAETSPALPSPTPQSTVNQAANEPKTDLRDTSPQPPGARPEPSPSTVSSSPAVVITDDLPPPTTIRAPSKAPTRKTPTTKQTVTDQSGQLFEPVIITVPKREPDAIRPENATAQAPVAPPPRKCRIVSSQEQISLSGGGGSIGFFIDTGDPADLRTMKYFTSSPKDLSVRREPRLSSSDDRGFFIVRTLTRNPGTYQVVFEAACGRKEIVVNVR